VRLGALGVSACAADVSASWFPASKTVPDVHTGMQLNASAGESTIFTACMLRRALIEVDGCPDWAADVWAVAAWCRTASGRISRYEKINRQGLRCCCVVRRDATHMLVLWHGWVCMNNTPTPACRTSCIHCTCICVRLLCALVMLFWEAHSTA
jgi:hypothetical protein